MKVLILEACRSPEIEKDVTEAIILSQVFQENGIDYELYSNDGIWNNPINLNKDLIHNLLQDSLIDIIHFAVHGGQEGLVLQWSNDSYVGNRVTLCVLTGHQIGLLKGLREKLIVSGACSSAILAENFLAAGANAVVAPLTPISWSELGLFFKRFYLCYRGSRCVKESLNQAVSEFPQYSCYRVFEQSR